MSDNCLKVLQTDMDIGKNLPGLCSEIHPPSSRDAKQLMNVKDEVSNAQEEEIPVPITWQTMKTEHEVSCMSAWPLLSRFNRYVIAFCFPHPHLSVCLSINNAT
jgi:hypothetical protein